MKIEYNEKNKVKKKMEKKNEKKIGKIFHEI